MLKDYFKFYHHNDENCIYTGRVTTTVGKDINQNRVMVMWLDEGELDGSIYTRDIVEEFIQEGVWVVIDE